MSFKSFVANSDPKLKAVMQTLKENLFLSVDSTKGFKVP